MMMAKGGVDCNASCTSHAIEHLYCKDDSVSGALKDGDECGHSR